MSTTTATTPLVPPPTDRAPKMREPLTRRRRIRAWAMSALRDIVYAGAVFVWSIAAFILVTGVSVTASLLVFVIGVFVWVGFAYVVRWTTWVDRRLAGWQRHERLDAAYSRHATRGFLAVLKTAVSLDATSVRAVLLPATMALLGDWNWYLPRWLQWMPQISRESAATSTHTAHGTRIRSVPDSGHAVEAGPCNRGRATRGRQDRCGEPHRHVPLLRGRPSAVGLS